MSAGQELIAAHALLDAAGVPSGGDLPARVREVLADSARLQEALAARGRETDYDRLLARVEECGEGRSHLLLMLHDAALDGGREGEARGWAWLGSHHRWPRRQHGGTWHWFACDVGPGSDSLPQALCLALGGGRACPTCLDALLAVVEAIAGGRYVP